MIRSHARQRTTSWMAGIGPSSTIRARKVSREAAAEIGGMDRQTLRDWVIRFNEQGAVGLINIPSPGVPPKERSDMIRSLCRIRGIGKNVATVDDVGNLQGRTRRIAIVAMAGKLLIAIWRYVSSGIIPEGAQIAA